MKRVHLIDVLPLWIDTILHQIFISAALALDRSLDAVRWGDEPRGDFRNY